MIKPTLLAAGVGLGLGLLIGVTAGVSMGNNNQGEEKKAVSSVTVTTYIEPYTGVGSGVLKHGTIIRGDYKGPESIIGNFNEEGIKEFPGTWVIRKVVTD